MGSNRKKWVFNIIWFGPGWLYHGICTKDRLSVKTEKREEKSRV